VQNPRIDISDLGKTISTLSKSVSRRLDKNAKQQPTRIYNSLKSLCNERAYYVLV
jgi:hypothetical protein